MTAREFCYWLQGFFELNDLHKERPAGMTEQQMKTIKSHLALVFLHSIDEPDPTGGAHDPRQERPALAHDRADVLGVQDRLVRVQARQEPRKAEVLV